MHAWHLRAHGCPSQPRLEAGPESAGSASFGAPRDFMLRHNARRERKLRFPLGDGDVLIMSGEM